MNQTPQQIASAIYDAIKTNQSAQDLVRDEYSRLAIDIATTPQSAIQITSASVNGQSYAGVVQMTKTDRLEMLRILCWMFTNGKPRTRTQVIFSGAGRGGV